MSLLFLKTVFWLLDEFYDFSCVVQLLYISDVYTIFIHSKVNFQVFLKMNITFYILKMITCIVRNKCILRMVIVINLLWNLELRLSELKFESNLHVSMLYLVMCSQPLLTNFLFTEYTEYIMYYFQAISHCSGGCFCLFV